MTTANQVICPISEERVDENAARVAALVTVLWVGISLCLTSYWLMGVLAADFAIRAFTPGNWSLLRWLARKIVGFAGLPARPTAAAPKKFAAGLGMVFSVLIELSIGLQLTYVALALVAALLACALLEGLAGFCVGCYVYTYAILPFKKQ